MGRCRLGADERIVSKVCACLMLCAIRAGWPREGASARKRAQPVEHGPLQTQLYIWVSPTAHGGIARACAHTSLRQLATQTCSNYFKIAGIKPQTRDAVEERKRCVYQGNRQGRGREYRFRSDSGTHFPGSRLAVWQRQRRRLHDWSCVSRRSERLICGIHVHVPYIMWDTACTYT